MSCPRSPRAEPACLADALRPPAAAPHLLTRAVRLALTGVFLSAAMLPFAVSADTAQAAVPAVEIARHYDIPPGPLSAVLTRFSRESGVFLAGSSDLAQGKQSAGIRGEYGARAALVILLAGSGLEAVARDSGGYMLRSVARAADGLQVLEQVVVTDKAERAAGDLPFASAGSSSHLTREHIERFRGTSVGDMFQGTTGVLVAENRNSGGLDINIRGMQGQGRVPVLVDGSRQETTVYRGYAGVVSRSYVDPDLIGSVDIVKGPSMSAQGTGAVGGLVSMRTLSASDIVKDGKDRGLRIRASAIGNNTGSPMASGTKSGYSVGNEMFNNVYRMNCQYDCSRDNPLPTELAPSTGMDRPGLLDFKGWAGSIAAARRFETVDLVAAYAQRSQGNYYAGKHGPTPTVDLSNQVERGFWTDVTPTLSGASRFRGGESIANTEYASRTLLLKSNFYLPHEQSLELGYTRYDSEYGEMMPSMLIRFGQVLQAPSSEVTANTLTSRYKWNPEANDRLNLEANLWHTDIKSRNVSYPDSMVEANPNIEDMMGTERYKRWGLDISNTMDFRLAGELQWRYGMALQLEDVQPEKAPTYSNDVFMRDGERRELSVFTAAKYKPLPSLTLDAGIRWSDFKADDRTPPVIPEPGDYNCVDTDGDGACDQVSVHHTKSSGSAPMASLTWEPLTGLQFYALYAEALRMPSLFESTRGFSATQAFDVAVTPEHAYNREIGINLLRDGVFGERDKLRVKVSYFRNLVRDYLTRTSPNLWEESNYIGQLFTLRNIDKVELHGHELSLEYDAGYVFMSAGATSYSKIEVCHYGSYRRYDCTDYGLANSYINNMIPPNWHANATLGARLLDWRLTLGARTTIMGQRNSQPKSYDDTLHGSNWVVPWHKYAIYDLFASYKLNDSVKVDFNIDNLTDRYYLDALSLGLMPAPGRTARLSMTLQF